MDTTFIKLSNSERWRRENGCMEVYRHEILAEIDMKVFIIVFLLVLVRFFTWTWSNRTHFNMAERQILFAITFKRGRNPEIHDLHQRQEPSQVIYILSINCFIRMKKCTDEYIFILDLYDIGSQNMDYKQISKILPIISVSVNSKYNK